MIFLNNKQKPHRRTFFYSAGKIFSIALLFGTSLGNSHATQPGWSEISDTKIIDVCPENNFAGYNYNFSDRCKNIVLAWGAAAFNSSEDKMYIWGGGHHDYYGNEVYELDFLQNSVKRITDPGFPADPDARPAQTELAPFDGSQPNSRHTYDGMAYLQQDGLIWAFSGSLASKASGNDNLTWLFDIGNNRWNLDNSKGDIPRAVYGAVSAYDNATDTIFMHDRNALYSYKYAADGGRYTKLSAPTSLGLGINGVIDPNTNVFHIIGGGSHKAYRLAPETGYIEIDIPKSGDSDIVDAWSPGLAYNSKTKKINGWFGDGKLYEFDSELQSWSSVAYKNDPGPQVDAGTLSRFVYSQRKDAFIVYNSVYENAHVLTPIVEQDSTAPTIPAQLSYTEPYPNSISLTWDESDDNVGVASYRIYLNSTLISEQPKNVFKQMELTPGETRNYQISALDSAGNESPRSPILAFTPTVRTANMRLGNCEEEPELNDRSDIVFCEGWQDPDWWQKNGYLSDPIVNDPRALQFSHVDKTQIIEEGCVKGKCLEVTMEEGSTGALSAYWPLKEANIAPKTVFLRYYLKLAEDWSPKMCDSEGNEVGSGGKFPGIADPRTWADASGQCGNGGARSDGLNCWSMRSVFKDCSSGDGEACSSKPDAITRFGSYLYYGGQKDSTGDNGLWDDDDWGQSTGKGGTCGTVANNLSCGKSDSGVLEPGIWYQIEMQVDLNTPGQEDGTVRGWVNGELSYEKTNMLFRYEDHDFLHNRVIWLNIYKGGVQGNCNTSKVYLDQMVVALDSPIGGLDIPTANPPQLSLTVDIQEPPSNTPVTLSWVSSNVETCRASGLLEGNVSSIGDAIITAESSGSVRIDCFGPGGSVARKVDILVDGRPVQVELPPTGTANLYPPSELQVGAIEEDGIVLSWNAPEEGTAPSKYNIYMMNAKVGESTDLTYTHKTFIHGVAALYSIASVDEVGNISLHSEPITVNTPIDPNAPENSLKLLPIADTQLNASTFKNFGAKSSMDVGSIANSILTFPIELLPPENHVIEAKLVLNTLSEFSNATMNIYAVDGYWNELEASREYATRTPNTYWHSELGDWKDREQIENGTTPFATYELVDDDTPNEIVIDVTELVSLWKQGELDNFGFLLNLASEGNHRIATRENENSQLWPQLRITYSPLTTPENLTFNGMSNGTVDFYWDSAPIDENIVKYHIYANNIKVGESTTPYYQHDIVVYGTNILFNVVSESEEGYLSGKSAPLDVFVTNSGPNVNSTISLLATEDTMLNSSTHQILGQKETFDVGINSNGLLYFPINYLPTSIEIVKASIILNSVSEFGNGVLSVFTPSKQWSENDSNKVYALKSLGVQWDNIIGDWNDAYETPQGDIAISSVSLIDDDFPDEVAIDITDLTIGWHLGLIDNKGILLKIEDASNYRFVSKDSPNLNQRPIIRIEYVNNM